MKKVLAAVIAVLVLAMAGIACKKAPSTSGANKGATTETVQPQQVQPQQVQPQQDGEGSK
jgi:uncharacterized protein YxeA